MSMPRSMEQWIKATDRRLRRLEFRTTGQGDLDWSRPVYQSGWTDYGVYGTGWSGAAFRKLSTGMVIMVGLVRSGAVGYEVPTFTLPAGYRPSVNVLCDCSSYLDASNVRPARVAVYPSGSVCVEVGSSTWTSLANVTFLAEQ